MQAPTHTHTHTCAHLHPRPPAAGGCLAWVEQNGRRPLPQAAFRATAVWRLQDDATALSLALPANASGLVRRPPPPPAAAAPLAASARVPCCCCYSARGCGSPAVLVAARQPCQNRRSLPLPQRSHLALLLPSPPPLGLPTPTSLPTPLCAAPQVNDMAAAVRDMLQQGFVVRARTDADTVEARSGFAGRRDAIIAAGAQVGAGGWDWGGGGWGRVAGGGSGGSDPACGCRLSAGRCPAFLCRRDQPPPHAMRTHASTPAIPRLQVVASDYVYGAPSPDPSPAAGSGNGSSGNRSASGGAGLDAGYSVQLPGGLPGRCVGIGGGGGSEGAGAVQAYTAVEGAGGGGEDAIYCGPLLVQASAPEDAGAVAAAADSAAGIGGSGGSSSTGSSDPLPQPVVQQERASNGGADAGRLSALSAVALLGAAAAAFAAMA